MVEIQWGHSHCIQREVGVRGGTKIGREEEEWKVFKLLLLAKQRSCVTEEGSSSRRWTEEKASGERVMEDDIRD